MESRHPSSTNRPTRTPRERTEPPASQSAVSGRDPKSMSVGSHATWDYRAGNPSRDYPCRLNGLIYRYAPSTTPTLSPCSRRWRLGGGHAPIEMKALGTMKTPGGCARICSPPQLRTCIPPSPVRPCTLLGSAGRAVFHLGNSPYPGGRIPDSVAYGRSRVSHRHTPGIRTPGCSELLSRPQIRRHQHMVAGLIPLSRIRSTPRA